MISVAYAKPQNTFRMLVGLYQKFVTVWFLLLLSQTTIFWMYVCRSKLSVLARGCGLVIAIVVATTIAKAIAAENTFKGVWNPFGFTRKHKCVMSARQITPHIIITFCFMSLLCLSTKHLELSLLADPKHLVISTANPRIHWDLCLIKIFIGSFAGPETIFRSLADPRYLLWSFADPKLTQNTN